MKAIDGPKFSQGRTRSLAVRNWTRERRCSSWASVAPSLHCLGPFSSGPGADSEADILIPASPSPSPQSPRVAHLRSSSLPRWLVAPKTRLIFEGCSNGRGVGGRPSLIARTDPYVQNQCLRFLPKACDAKKRSSR